MHAERGGIAVDVPVGGGLGSRRAVVLDGLVGVQAREGCVGRGLDLLEGYGFGDYVFEELEAVFVGDGIG